MESKKVEANDRYLTDTLRRSEAINFLIEHNFDRKYIIKLNDDLLLYVYDTAKRKGKCAICDTDVGK